MAAKKPDREWKTLDSDLRRQNMVERGTFYVSRPLVAPGIALAFIAICGLGGAAISGVGLEMVALGFSALISAYLAINIGANDVGNNMGPAVGAGAISLGTALLLSAVAEVLGAMLAGHEVIAAIGWGIVPPEASPDAETHVRIMISAMIAAGLWLNIATLISAPVSTTHSIVGGVLGAAVMALGPQAVNWLTVINFSFGWVSAPIVAGALAAGLLWILDKKVTQADDRRAAIIRWAPRLLGAMAGVFTAFILHDVVMGLIAMPTWLPIAAGLVAAVLTALGIRPLIVRRSATIGNSKQQMRSLFSVPLVISAVCFSFAHGANDVSNAVGPLAVIVSQLTQSGDAGAPSVMVLALGGLGIALGVLLFGPRLVRIVGSEITRLNPIRSFCVMLAAATTVIAATSLALPVSSTHTAIGAIFGIGIYREQKEARLAKKLAAERQAGPQGDERARRHLVRRSHLRTIISAWLITVPISAMLAALIVSLFGWLVS